MTHYLDIVIVEGFGTVCALREGGPKGPIVATGPDIRSLIPSVGLIEDELR